MVRQKHESNEKLIYQIGCTVFEYLNSELQALHKRNQASFKRVDEIEAGRYRYEELVFVDYLGKNVYYVEERDFKKGIIRHTIVNSKTIEMKHSYNNQK